MNICKMVYFDLAVRTLMILFLSHYTTGNRSSKDQGIYVSLSGADFDSCGSLRQPCRSIPQAVRQVNGSGAIFLNGTGTDKNPYDCKVSREFDCRRGLYINKSLCLKSHFSAAVVSCEEGIFFQRETQTRQRLEFEISGIIFLRTVLRFEDCNGVNISNCSFLESSFALKIHLRTVTRFSLDIRGSTLFWNNSLCIQLMLFNKDCYVAITIRETRFLINGRHRRGLLHVGVIEVTAKSKAASRLYLDVFCNNVCSNRNQGFFLKNNVRSAITRELYTNVQMNHNQGTSPYPVASRRDQIGSLYMSQAKNVSAIFTGLRCINNTMLRCISVTSEDIAIEIETSQFAGQSVVNSVGGCVSLESSGRISLAIFNSSFSKNKAEAGGALSINCPNGIVSLNLTSITFSKCSSKTYGSAVLVGRILHHSRIMSPRRLYANFRNVTVKKCSGMKPGSWSKSVYLLLESGKVTIENSTWSNNTEAVRGALLVSARGGRVDVEIVNCNFIDNGAPRGIAAVTLTSRNHVGNAKIVNTSFINKKKRRRYMAMNISGEYSVTLCNLTITKFSLGLYIPLIKSQLVHHVNVYVDKCKFIENIKDIIIYLPQPRSTQLSITNSFFTSRLLNDSSFAVRIVIPSLKNINVSSAVIEMENNTFDSKPSSGIALFFKGNKSVKIRHTTFRNCRCFRLKHWAKHRNSSRGSFRETASGAISILTEPDTPLNFGCVESDSANDTHPLWSYDSHVLFEDTNFIENVGLLAGGAYISNGNTTFKRCIFQDNFASRKPGHVYSAFGTGQVNFVDCSFLNQKKRKKVNNISFDKATFFYSESEGPVHFQNTTMVTKVADAEKSAFSVFEISNGGFVKMDINSTIQCSTGYNLELDNNTHFVYTVKDKNDCRKNITVLRYSCRPCSPGVYSLLKGVSHGVVIDRTIKCLTCPFGASCVHQNIAAKPNFWGYRISNNPPQLKFLACPENYCKSPPSRSPHYNSCHGNRTGFLCGKCLPEYSETLFSTGCRKRTECNNLWLWAITILLLTTTFVLYLLIKPPLLSYLTTQIFWFRKGNEEQVTQDLGQVKENSDNGYLKITFYFYQAADLIFVGSTENLLHAIPFVYAVADVFNFQLQSLDDRIGCPIEGITVVTKELILSATVLVTLAEVAILFCLHSVFNFIRQKGRPSGLHYLAVGLEILLLGYERLAETSLKLMHCVHVGSEQRLFLNGEVLCWQWWQYILLGYIGIFVVPFVMVLYYGSTALHKDSISIREFLGACICPLPFLMFWLFKKMLKKTEKAHRNKAKYKHILDVLHGPFRQPNSDDNGTIYWESILIGRRLVLLSCHAFLATPMFRMVCMTGACTFMLLHHVLKNPFRNPIANKAETLSLLTLVMMAVINLTKATLISFGTSTEGPAKSYMEILEWCEVCALAFVPSLLSFFVIFAIFSQLIRLTTAVAKKVSQWLQWRRLSLGFTTEQETPLLTTSVEE